jgi:hypothetical protein
MDIQWLDRTPLPDSIERDGDGGEKLAHMIGEANIFLASAEGGWP